MDGIIEDKELGRLVVHVNSRARQLVFRTKSDAIHVSVPPGTTLKEIMQAVDELRERLREHQTKTSRSIIDLNYQIDSEFFKLSFITGQQDRFLAKSKQGEMQIICPSTAYFADEKLQVWLRKAIAEAMKKNARIILPVRLAALSKQCNLPYASVKINSSQGRWGSCSSQNSINLSYFLILLPAYLIDYVLLHELCHTREMNHSERFWTLLNSLTDRKALALRKELKNIEPICIKLLLC